MGDYLSDTTTYLLFSPRAEPKTNHVRQNLLATPLY